MLYLLPNLLSEDGDIEELPAVIPKILKKLDLLIAESREEGIRYLKRFKEERLIPTIILLNEHTKPEEVASLIKGKTAGLISDAGMPLLADPGEELVALHTKVKPLYGPFAPFELLLRSGLPAERFTFHGYLPREEKERIAALKKMEMGIAHLWIEAPYRVDHMIETALKILPPKAIFGVGANLTSKLEKIILFPISSFPKIKLGKVPAVFLLFKKSPN